MALPLLPSIAVIVGTGAAIYYIPKLVEKISNPLNEISESLKDMDDRLADFGIGKKKDKNNPCITPRRIINPTMSIFINGSFIWTCGIHESRVLSFRLLEYTPSRVLS